MSKTSRRPDRRHRHEARFTEGEDYQVQVAWCATWDDLDEASDKAKDLLVKKLGFRRSGPVRIRVCTGDDAAAAMDVLKSQPVVDHGVYEYYRRISALLREYGGWVVVAAAQGKLPA